MKHYCNPMNLEYRYQFYRKLQVGSEPVHLRCIVKQQIHR